MKFLFSLLLFFTGLALLRGQIINVESQRLSTDTTGWHGLYNLTVDYVKNTNQLLTINNNLTAEYVKDRSNWLFLHSLNTSISNLATIENSLFFHVRYNYRKTKRLTYEVLTQYQKNVPLKIDHRVLTGLGPRFGFIKKKNFELYGATILLYEYDNELETEIEHSDLRLSSYISTEYKLNDKVEWVAVVYYQPRIDYWEDFRTTLQTQLRFLIFKSLAFTSTYMMSYDAFPVQDESIPNLTIKWTNGITYRF